MDGQTDRQTDTSLSQRPALAERRAGNDNQKRCASTTVIRVNGQNSANKIRHGRRTFVAVANGVEVDVVAVVIEEHERQP